MFTMKNNLSVRYFRMFEEYVINKRFAHRCLCHVKKLHVMAVTLWRYIMSLPSRPCHSHFLLCHCRYTTLSLRYQDNHTYMLIDFVHLIQKELCWMRFKPFDIFELNFYTNTIELGKCYCCHKICPYRNKTRDHNDSDRNGSDNL